MTQAHRYLLTACNTFGIEATADNYCEVDSLSQLAEISALGGRRFVLGGGSNILICGDLHGCVVHNRLSGYTILRRDDTHVYIEVNSGEVWHDTVMMAVKNGWGGIENLALIPGTVGAAPIQNIGAYGVEAKDVITEVRYWDWALRRIVTLSNAECAFGYRDSVFKRELHDRFFITSVVLKLSLHPIVNIRYGAISSELAAMGIQSPGIADVAEAVIRIRSSKLPDPRKLGNAGSFFKNPEIDGPAFSSLEAEYPGIPSYEVGPDKPGWKKIPAGWLIEQCGWKGHREGPVGVHEKQALVIVNHGGATGADILRLANKIVDSVRARFGIKLEMEVRIWTS
jgi:UDP-N-acetylmuramate dehydrogenase